MDTPGYEYLRRMVIGSGSQILNLSLVLNCKGADCFQGNPNTSTVSKWVGLGRGSLLALLLQIFLMVKLTHNGRTRHQGYNTVLVLEHTVSMPTKYRYPTPSRITYLQRIVIPTYPRLPYHTRRYQTQTQILYSTT